MTVILGISAFYHDSAATIVVDGEIVAAAQEERFSRVKHDHRFPAAAIDYCLREAGVSEGEVDFVAFYEKPLLKFDRILETYCAFAPRGFRSFARVIPPWLKEKLHLTREIKRRLAGYRKRCVFAEHHESHAASAFFPSPFEEAAVLTVDGVGEWATATCGVGRGNRVRLAEELHFPHSLGMLYSAFTYYCGFEVDSGEYKLMGLAPYGQPQYVDAIMQRLVDARPDGSLWMDMSYFSYCQGLAMTSAKFHRLFGGPPRRPDEPLEERHLDLAASIQRVTEEILLRMAVHVHEQSGLAKLCMAGGVALNCVANGRILREGPFDAVWIQPAAGDAGGALGAALLVWHQLLENPRTPSPTDAQCGSLLGPSFSATEIRQQLEDSGATFEEFSDETVLCRHAAELLAERKVVGWFQGRLEFGPRALGNRSILADARDARMQDTLNQKIKFRESFRPFAPAVLAEHAGDYFRLPHRAESPYMLLVADVCPAKRRCIEECEEPRGLQKQKVARSEIPAVTHVDCSARLQTVGDARFGTFARLLRAFHERTGCPLLINTSFNVRDEPIVCSPRDAYECFLATEMDALVIDRFVLLKPEQPRMNDRSGPSRPAQRGRKGTTGSFSLVEVDRDPSPHQLLLFGIGLSTFAVLLAVLGFWSTNWQVVCWCCAAVIAAMAVVFFACRPTRRPIYLGWMHLNFPIACAVSLLALAVIYYLVVCLIGVAMRCLGRDALQQRRTRSAKTHWVGRSADGDKARYLRQF